MGMENEYKTVLADFKDGKATFYSKTPISKNVFLDEDTGFLYCKNSILGNAGVQKYYGKELGLTDEDADKVIEMVRDEQDVFDEVSLSSFEGKPVTLFHPKEKVNSKNYKKVTVGSIKDVKPNEKNILGDIVIYDDYTIQKILKDELKDLSLGYKAKVIQLADGRYKQTEIVINHLAIVEEGRAINAQIVDENTVKEEETQLEPQDRSDELEKMFQDKIHVTHSKETRERVNEYDDETGEETTKEVSVYESKHTHYEKALQLLQDHEKQRKEKGDPDMDKKDFNYFIDEVKKLSVYPQSEFRDAAYKALADECQETLGVKLLTFNDVKVNAIEESVGFKKEEEFKDEKETKTLQTYAEDETLFFDNLYRKMDNVEEARKYGKMTYRDVYAAIREGRTL